MPDALSPALDAPPGGPVPGADEDPRPENEPESQGAGPALVARASRFLDGALDVAVAALASWTLIYGAMQLGLPLAVGTGIWVVVTLGLVALRSRREWFRRSAPRGWLGPTVAMVASVGAAVLASVIRRPEWDDAWYVVRSTWVADHGDVGSRDILFTEGQWPSTVGASFNLSSFEILLGAVARYTGVPAGDVVYRYFVPLAAFAAIWALWGLFIAWGARRPTASLVLAIAFILLGGYGHATFGNMHLTRIWQGKAVLLAILVPYLYSVIAAVIRERSPSWSTSRGAALVLGGTGIAAVGASSTAVFVVPLIASVAIMPLLWRRQWSASPAIVALVVGPLVAGVITVLSPGGTQNAFGVATAAPWARALADGRVAVVALVTAVALLLGVLLPRWWRTVDDRLQAPLLAVAVGGVLFTVEPLYSLFTTFMGGDAIAHRLAWVIPLPAFVGLIASLPARRFAFPLAPVAALTAALLLMAGTPLWSAANGAHWARPGSWKVRAPEDLAAARWVVEQQPEGRYLAANWVTFLVGTISSEPRPVGTRLDYVEALSEVPGSQVEDRLLLQQVADGADARTAANRKPAIAALAALDVSAACVAWDDEFTQDVFGAAGFSTEWSLGPWTCWSAEEERTR